MNYKFDILPNRRKVNSYKWDVKDNELPMWVADMDFKTCPHVIKAIKKKISNGAIGYSYIPDSYFEAYHNFYLRHHNVDFDKSWMIFTTGVVAAMSSIVRSVTSINDNVVVLEPCYNIFYNSIINNKRNVSASSLIRNGDDYLIDYDDLENRFKDDKTTLLIFCNPHNPVGKIFSKEELSKVNELANKYNVTILSDEIHGNNVDPGYFYNPFYSISGDTNNVITAVSCGKAFNLAGLQSACIIIKDKILKAKVERGLNNDEVAEPNFIAIEGNIAALNKGDKWLKQVNAYIYKNKRYMREFVNNKLPHLHIINSHATYLLWMDCTYYKKSAKELCAELRESTGLYLASGEAYGVSGTNYIRINMATSFKNVKDACNRLYKYFSKLD